METLEYTPYIIGMPEIYSPKGKYTLLGEGGVSNKYNFEYEKGHLEILPSAAILYPNPVADNITVLVDEVLSEGVQIEIINRSGQLVSSTTLTSVINSLEMDLSHIKPGIYILRIVFIRKN